MPNWRHTSAGLHFSVQTASTAWALSIAGRGGLGLRLRWVFGMEVVAEFLGGLFIGQFEFEFAFFRAQDDRLAFHPPDHVEGRARFSAQGHLQEIVLDPGLEGLAQLGLDFEKAVRRAKAANALVGPLVIVVLDPELDALARVLERIELRAHQEVLPDRGPEALDLAQGHGMLRAAFEVLDPVLAQLGFKARSAAPGGVLPAIIGEHLFGRLKLTHPHPIHFNHCCGRWTAEQIGAGDEARVIIQERDQVGVLASQPESEDVRLPHLIGRGPLEETGPRKVALLFRRRRLHEAGLVQFLAHRLRAGLHPEAPAQPLGDALDPKTRVLPLELQDRLGDGRRHPARAGPARQRVAGMVFEAFLAQLAIDLHPAREGLLGGAQLLGNQAAAIPFLQIQLNRFEFQFERIGRNSLFSAPFSSPLGGKKLFPLRGKLS